MQDRREFIKNSIYISSFTMIAGSALSACSKKTNYNLLQQIPSTSPYTMKHLRGKVGYFKERGGTIGWLIDQKESAVVDTQFPDQAKHFIEERNKLTTGVIQAVFNTHHHGDHTAGNIAFKDLTKVVIAHENSLKHQRESAEKSNSLANTLLPNETFRESYKTKIGSENISCHYFGVAHTDGDSIVHFEDSNVIHLGDLVFNRRFPYIDMAAGASISNWVNVLDKVKNYADDSTQFICGHAGEKYDIIINKEDIKAFQNYLTKLHDFGKKSIMDGLAKEQVLANTKVIPGAEEWTGDGIARSIEAIYTELNRK
jgi:cyclase